MRAPHNTRLARRFAIGVLCALAFGPPATRAEVAGVTMAPATPGGIRFTVSVPEPSFVSVPGPEGFTRLELDGWSPDGAPGEVALPRRVVSVAVPPLGDVRVSAVGSERTAQPGLLLAPIPHESTPKGDEAPVLSWTKNPASYTRRVPLEGPRARLLGVSWLRNQRVARIAIEPVAWDPASRELVIDRRVDVDVQVEPMALGAPAEAQDPFEDLYRSSLANYAQGMSWRRPAVAALRAAARARGADPAQAFGAAVVETTSVFAGRSWVRLSVTQPGFYKVNFSQLRDIALFPDTLVKLDSLRLFTLPGFPVLPETDYCDQCDYREVSLGFKDVYSDGIFGNNSDAFYFFALGPSDWADTYDPARPDTSYINNPYESKNFYYLTVASALQPVGGTPQRIGSRSGTPVGGETEPTTYEDRIHFERDEVYWPDASPREGNNLFWEKFFWRTLDDVSSTTYDVDGIDLPAADTTQAARFRMRAWGVTQLVYDNINCAFSLYPDHLLDVGVNDLAFPRRGYVGFQGNSRAGQTWDTTSVFLRTRNNTIHLFVPNTQETNTCPIRNDKSALAWFDLYYQRRFVPVNDSLEFRTAPGPGTYLYRVGPFVSARPPRVFDVTDPLRPEEVLGGTFSGTDGAWQFAFRDVQGGRRRFRILPDSLLSNDASRMASSAISLAPGTSLRNLRSATNRADYLIIYYDGFGAASDTLLRWRREHLPLTNRSAPFDTMSIPISALYDQFSGGRTDPAAIRNFLRAAFLNWAKPPAFVQFLGDASYDFKNILGYAPAGQPGSLVPSFEGGFDQIVSRQFATDDWLLNIDNALSLLPDFFGGRLPCVDATNALDVVRRKVLAYERTAPLGEYRNRVLLLGDDNLQNCKCDGLVWAHLQQSTQIDTSFVPPHFDRAYVYLHTYPSAQPNCTRPGARAELKDWLNRGVTVFNYFGHGSPFKIADESVFLDSDAGTLTNTNLLPLFVAASCDVGKFNDPSVTSLGERMVLSPTTGAVGVISATELALSSQNANLARAFYSRLFSRDDVLVPRGGATGIVDTLRGVGQYHLPVSAALLGAKVSLGGTEQSLRKYQLMGDAALRLNFPRLWTDLTVEDENGQPLTELRRGATVVVHGRVLDRPGGTLVPYSGTVSLQAEDSAPTDQVNPGGFCSQNDVFYRFKAGPMYRGDLSVTNGTFTGKFVVPLDATGGPDGRVRAYVTGREATEAFDSDGSGSLITQVSAGTPPSGDTEGPRIVLAFAGGATSVRPDATLRIDLFDPSGIMITGHSLQNSIVVTLDGNTTQRTDVTSSFRYAANSYQAGVATFVLPNLAPGAHTISVTAADNLALGIAAANHRSSATIEFDVVSVPPMSITRTYLFPTPTRSGGPGSGGQFVIDAPGDSINSMVRIYTVSGRLVRTLKAFGSIGQAQLAWDGLDDEGSPLANGTYLFKAYVSVRDETGRSSARQKAAGEGRFVIVGGKR